MEKIEKIYARLFEFSSGSYFNWLKEKRPVMLFFRKYFSKKEISEIDKDGTCPKMEDLILANSVLVEFICPELNKLSEDFIDDFFQASATVNTRNEEIKKAERVLKIMLEDEESLKKKLTRFLEKRASVNTLHEVDEMIIYFLYQLSKRTDNASDFQDIIRSICNRKPA